MKVFKCCATLLLPRVCLSFPRSKYLNRAKIVVFSTDKAFQGKNEL